MAIWHCFVDVRRMKSAIISDAYACMLKQLLRKVRFSDKAEW